MAGHDSAGGTFIEHNGQWKLAGINYGTEYSFKLSSSDPNTISAAIYDKSGLFRPDGTSAGTGPAMSYATRISSNLDFLYTYVEAPPVTLASYTVNKNDDVGDVDVSGNVTLGVFARLRAYHVRSGSLSIGNNATATIKPNGGDRGVSRVSSLTLGNNARLDLNDNDLIVQATDSTHAAVLAQVANWVKSGRNGTFAWQGPGIGSTAAHDDTSGKMVLGVGRTAMGRAWRSTTRGAGWMWMRIRCW